MTFQNKTIEELEEIVWNEPTFESSLVLNCHRLRKLPIHQFCSSDYRLMISQAIGLPYIIPGALAIIETDPMAEDLFPGDLIEAVVSIAPSYWEAHPELQTACNKTCEKVVTYFEARFEPLIKKAAEAYGAIFDFKAAAEAEEYKAYSGCLKFISMP